MKKILIVEDEEFLIDAYQIKLKSESFSVDIARDGDEAIQKIDTENYAVFVLDLILPKKNGLEILTYIRNKAETKSTPVIIASNIDKKETFEQAIKLGANDFFIKSEISLSDLMGKIQSYLT